jgi:hypothetical protein
MGQTFHIDLVLSTECAEMITAFEVRKWLTERFAGCDVGKVEIARVDERSTMRGVTKKD